MWIQISKETTLDLPNAPKLFSLTPVPTTPRFGFIMKFAITSLLMLAIAATASCRSLEKRSSSSWGGGNLYFLHGLSDSDQNSYINTMASDGAKVVRLWGM